MVAETRHICQKCKTFTTAAPLVRLDLVLALCSPCQAGFERAEWQWAHEQYLRSIGANWYEKTRRAASPPDPRHVD